MPRKSYGPMFGADRSLLYVSPSSATKGDASSYGGCEKRWWFHYLGGHKEEQTASQKKGDGLHLEIENHLKSGQRAFSTLLLTGLHYLPKPGDDLLIEHPLADDLATAPLRPAGVPMIGYMDCVNPRGINYGAADVTVTQDPPKTAETIDWKSTKDPRYIKAAEEIADTIQMTSYGMWCVVHGAEWARLSHVYFITGRRAPAKKVSALRPAEKVLARWGYVEGVVRTLIDVAKSLDASHVPGNVKACDAYGGCPHRSYCDDYQRGVRTNFFGDEPMSLLANLKSANPPSAPPPPAPTPTAQSMGIKAKMEELRANLAAAEAREAAAKAKAPAVTIPPGWREALDWLALPRDEADGMPAFAGEALKVYAAVRHTEVRGDGLAGSGALGSVTVSDPAELFVLAQELGYVPGGTVEATAPVANIVEVAPVAILPPDVPESAGVAAVEATPKRRGRKPKETAPITPAELAAMPPAVSQRAATEGKETLTVFVDVAEVSIPTESLNRYVDQIHEYICKQEGCVDIRCGNPDGKLGFGRWKGVLAAFVKEAVTTKQIPAGVYRLEVRGSEIATVAAEALRGLADVFVWGGGR